MTFSLDKHRMNIECPKCRFPARPFLRQVRLSDVMVCGGCKGNIRLVDHLCSFRKAERKVSRTMEELTLAMKELGKH